MNLGLFGGLARFPVGLPRPSSSLRAASCAGSRPHRSGRPAGGASRCLAVVLVVPRVAPTLRGRLLPSYPPCLLPPLCPLFPPQCPRCSLPRPPVRRRPSRRAAFVPPPSLPSLFLGSSFGVLSLRPPSGARLPAAPRPALRSSLRCGALLGRRGGFGWPVFSSPCAVLRVWCANGAGMR